jgi:hypothetical protein
MEQEAQWIKKPKGARSRKEQEAQGIKEPKRSKNHQKAQWSKENEEARRSIKL